MLRIKPLSSLMIVAMLLSLALSAHAAATTAAATTPSTTTAPKTTAPKTTTTTTKAATPKPTEAMKVDINTASKADLMKLPGIGDAISTKIVAGRPWTSKSQLLQKGIVNQTQYDKMSPYIIAHAPTTTSAAKK